MGFYNVLKIFFVCGLFQDFSSANNCKQETNCQYEYVYKMKGASCGNKDFREIPKCLQSDVEIIDLTCNRIRKVSNEDLKRYPYVKHLYLTDNLLVNLDEDTFENIDSLETLGLAMNSITKLPYTVFQLPTLKTLYLSQNLNINIIDAIEKARPISSPLTKMDMSYITDKDFSVDFPDFGTMPMLALLNVTGNQFKTLTPSYFAGLCNLQIFPNVNVTVEYYEDCDCWTINKWLKERKVTFNSFICPQNQKECADKQLSDDVLTTYHECRKIIEQIEHSSRMKKIGIGIGISLAVIIVLSALLLWVLRKRVHKNKKAENLRNLEMKAKVDGQSEQLLNNKSYPKNM